jgi:hypothetical protein
MDRCDRRRVPFRVAAAAALDHRAVVAFSYDHGIDPTEDPVWEVPWLFDFDAPVTSETALAVEVRIEFDGDDATGSDPNSG